MPWLMKAEPDSRIVKGKDVKFSVDDFEAMGTSPWDGVRSHEAKKIMKERMEVGDQVLFYHSNTKTPGVFALAEVAKEGYPDHTAWDASHPYFDEKTKRDEPTWFMVDVRFIRRLPHPPTLALIKMLAATPSLPGEVEYIGAEGLKAIKEMQLVNRGRLSVQTVEQAAYDAVVLLGDHGGWDSLISTKAKPTPSASNGNATVKEDKPQPNGVVKTKRKSAADDSSQAATPPSRRSRRNK